MRTERTDPYESNVSRRRVRSGAPDRTRRRDFQDWNWNDAFSLYVFDRLRLVYGAVESKTPW